MGVFRSILILLTINFLLSLSAVAQVPGSGLAFWQYTGAEYGDPIADTGPICFDNASNKVLQTTADRIVFAGTFLTARVCTGSVVQINKSDSKLKNKNTTHRVNGTTNISISDGAGGWYIGGTFTTVEGVTRTHVARINSDGSLNTTFSPPNITTSVVSALYLDGTDLYVGGNFVTVSGTTRRAAIKLDATTGAWQTGWDPNFGTSSVVYSFTKYGGRIYAGGNFSSVGAYLVSNLVALSTTDGAIDLTRNLPNTTNTGYILSLLTVSNTIYVAGSFSTAGNAGYGAIIDATSGTQVTGFPYINGAIRAIIPDGSGGWYIGGDFTNVGGLTRNRAARILSDKSVGSWNPNVNNAVYALHKKGSLIYLGGTFTAIGGSGANYVGVVNDSDGAKQVWSVSVTGTSVAAIESSGSKIFIAGTFTHVNGAIKNNFAALDETAGSILDVGLSFDNTVSALHNKSGMLYIGGSYTGIGQSSYGVPIDIATAAQASANFPTVNGVIYTTISDGAGGWYIGGQFTNVGGVARTNLAHIQSDLTVGSWNPTANSSVYGLAKNGSIIYVGGDFNNLNGTGRTYIGAVTTSGTLFTSFTAISMNNGVRAVEYYNNKVYIGGQFDGSSGARRNGLAVVDATTGQLTDENFSTNGMVTALKVYDSKLYVGGTFNMLGHFTTGRTMSLATALTLNKSPAIEGAVTVSLPDGSGGWYIAGNFTAVNGVTRNRFAHIQSDGSLGSLNLNANSNITSMYVSGTTMYLGGLFSIIAGVARTAAVRVSTVTGVADTWNPNPDAQVTAIKLVGNKVFLGGAFSTVSGAAVRGLAIVDDATGALIGEQISVNNQVLTLEDDGANLFAGGAFSSAGKLNYAYVVDQNIGLSTVSNFPYINGQVKVMIPDELGGWYIGGTFSSVGGLTRNRAAQIASDGTVTSWNPNFNSTVNTMIKDGSYVYVGGQFSTVSGTARTGIARIHATTGALDTTWLTASANNTVYALLLDGTTLYVGGNFVNIGGVGRYSVASIDITGSGTVNAAFNAAISTAAAPVYSLAKSGTDLFLGFSTFTISGNSRTGLVSVNATTGALGAWNPTVNNIVYSMAVSGSVLYIGGTFTNVSGSSRNRLAALTIGGSLEAWNPNSTTTVNYLSLKDGNILVAGAFTTVGGANRTYFAEITSTGTATAWNPNAGGSSGQFIAGDGSNILIGGNLTMAGNPLRDNLLSIDIATQTLNSWAPNPNSTVRALYRDGNDLYVGGGFSSISSVSRTALTVINKDTGVAGSLTMPPVGNVVYSFAIDGGYAYTAGQFTAPGVSAVNVAKIDLATGLSQSSFNPNTLYAGAQGSGACNTISVYSGEAFIGCSLPGTMSPITRSRIGAFSLTDKSITSFDPNISGPYVYAIDSDGGSQLYLGGQFSTVSGTIRNNLAVVDKDTGVLGGTNFNPNGTVRTLLNIGANLYIGGDFSAILGQTRVDMASITTADNTITSWQAQSNGMVFSLSYSGGANLYVGGQFTQAAGVKRSYISSVDTTGLNLSNWDLGLAGGAVNAITSVGSNIYYGGNFSSVSGTARNKLAASDETTAVLQDWNPSANSQVLTMASSGSVIYIGGQFTTMSGTSRVKFAAVDTTGNLLSVSPLIDTGFTVNAVGADASGLFVGGSGGVGTYVGRFARTNLFSFDADTHQVLPMALNPSGIAYTLAKSDVNDNVYVGGNFTSISSQARGYGAEIDAITQEITSWNPRANGLIRGMAVDNNLVYLAGDFTAVSSTVQRNYLAAVKIDDSTPAEWNPNSNNTTNTTTVGADYVFVGGSIGAIGNITRNRMAAVDTTTGNLTTWDPNFNNQVMDMVLWNNKLYVGGWFSTVGGVSRSFLTSVDSRTARGSSLGGLALNNAVYAMYVSGTTMYLGGIFTTLGGSARSNAGAINLTNNSLLSWNPNANQQVLAITGTDTDIYLGGYFTTIGGTARAYLASVSPVSGTLTPSMGNQNANNVVRALTIASGTLYVGGTFTTIGGQSRGRMAAYNTSDNTLTAWNPNVSNNSVYTIVASGSTLYIGGDFSTVSGTARTNVAQVNMSNGTLTAWNSNAYRTSGTISDIKILSDGTIALAGNGGVVFNTNKTGFSVIDAILGSILY